MFLRRIRLRYRSYPRMIRTSIFFPPLCLKPFFFQTDLGVSSKRNPNPNQNPKQDAKVSELTLPFKRPSSPSASAILVHRTSSQDLSAHLHLLPSNYPFSPRNFLTGNPPSFCTGAATKACSLHGDGYPHTLPAFLSTSQTRPSYSEQTIAFSLHPHTFFPIASFLPSPPTHTMPLQRSS